MPFVFTVVRTDRTGKRGGRRDALHIGNCLKRITTNIECTYSYLLEYFMYYCTKSYTKVHIVKSEVTLRLVVSLHSHEIEQSIDSARTTFL